MATQKELGDKFELFIEKYSNFKIGKTGQTSQERYDQEYSKIYSKIVEVGNSDEKETIDDFEKYMIERFGDLSNCDNQQVGGGDMTDSKVYLVYIVYN